MVDLVNCFIMIVDQAS